MKRRMSILPLILSAAGMVCLILDGKCASGAVQDGIQLCLCTVIPALFPLFVLSGVLVCALSELRIPVLSKALGIPEGSEGIFLLGAIGGFPMGAQCIAQAVEQGSLNKQSAQRMLGFCNNAGPAFLFGILGGIFDNPIVPLVLFVIQLESAFLVGMLWRSETSMAARLPKSEISLPNSVSRAVRSMVSVCAWVILANVLLALLDRWLFPFLPELAQVSITGTLELTNGCLTLEDVESENLRFILCCGFLNFGGLSVLMQIQAIAGRAQLSVRTCVHQKICQAMLSMAVGAVYLWLGPAGMLISIGLIPVLKIAVEKYGGMVYNSPNKGGISHAFQKKDAPFLSVLRSQHQVYIGSDALHQIRRGQRNL